MDQIRNYIVLVGLIFVFSCSDTNAIYSPIEVIDTPDAEPITGLFKKHVLIEDYTGTWCGNCTRVSYAIEKVHEATDEAVSVAIHYGPNTDPYNFMAIEPLKNLISPAGDLELPQSRLNRITKWTYPEDANTQQAINLTSNNCGLGLALSSTVADNMINLDVVTKFAQNYQNIKLVVYVLENHLMYRQTNYFASFGVVPTIPVFEHNHVLRAGLTNLLGNPLSSTTFGQTVTTHFSVPVPANVTNANNISFVAFVVGADHSVLNVRAAESNETQSLEENH